MSTVKVSGINIVQKFKQLENEINENKSKIEELESKIYQLEVKVNGLSENHPAF